MGRLSPTVWCRAFLPSLAFFKVCPWDVGEFPNRGSSSLSTRLLKLVFCTIAIAYQVAIKRCIRAKSFTIDRSKRRRTTGLHPAFPRKIYIILHYTM